MTEFERCLRYGRINKKMSQRDVAELAGIETGDIAKLESGIFVHLENNTLCLLASAVNMEPGMFSAMYRSEFQQELKRSPAATPPRSEQFAELEKAILALPADAKEKLLQMILRVLIPAAA